MSKPWGATSASFFKWSLSKRQVMRAMVLGNASLAGKSVLSWVQCRYSPKCRRMSVILAIKYMIDKPWTRPRRNSA
jgi:hypothetical protein